MTTRFYAYIGVEGVTADMSSTSLRSGAVDDMILNNKLDIIDAICRGGWDWDGDCRLLTYLDKYLRVLRAGIVLAGYKNPEIVPSFTDPDDFITEQNRSKVLAMSRELFHTPDVPAWSPTGSLKDFRKILLARVIAADEDVVRLCGEECSLHRSLIVVARRNGVTSSELKQWGITIRSRFLARSRGAEKEVNGTTVAERVQTRQELLIDNVIDMRKEVAQVKNENNELKGELKQIKVSLFSWLLLPGCCCLRANSLPYMMCYLMR